MAILVTGGAGSIGSVTVDLLRQRGVNVVVLDDLTRGHRSSVDDDVNFYQGSIGDRELVKRICAEHEIEACIHFAALAYVGESVEDPKKYFENNVSNGIGLLTALLESNVKRFVFSSTCATYGEPVRIPIDEDHPQNPANPYGWSKLILERALAAYDQAYGFKYVALRYFNASGAANGKGEDHDPETHLIPNILRAALGRLHHVSVFGDDYQTPDGTAIRDYIHVIDLAAAHLLALDYLKGGGSSEFLNLGTGRGFSVMEIIETARRITGREIGTRLEPRRAGDPSQLIAAADKAARVLGWRAQHSSLDEIISSAWEWHSRELI
jgi:UDP-glucose 4-epimerase